MIDASSALASSPLASSETFALVLRKLVFGDGLLTLFRAGLDRPFAVRDEGERANPSAVVTEEFCRFEFGGRAEFGEFKDLDDVEFGGGGLLLTLVMAVGDIDGKRSPAIHYYYCFV